MPARKRDRRGQGSVLGHHTPPPKKPYVRGASGLTRPDPDAVYVLDGVPHRFDGKCHPDCENLR